LAVKLVVGEEGYIDEDMGCGVDIFLGVIENKVSK
jgi:hypothetical protein